MTTQKINSKITRLFRKHKVRPVQGEEGFWLAVKKVAVKSSTDARKLETLASEWEVAFRKEQRSRFGR